MQNQDRRNPLVAIILINWNGLNDTIECILSLQQQRYRSFRVVVVDNASTGNDLEQLRKRFGDTIVLLPNPQNDGFALGNNHGIEYAKNHFSPDYYWLLNNDTVVEPATLEALVQHANIHPHDGIIGSFIRYWGADRIYCLGGASFNQWTGIDKLYGAKLPLQRSFTPQRFSYISGCSMFLASRVLHDVKGFDPDYFLYSEEADFCFRARQYGHLLCYEPQSIVDHKVAQSSQYLSETYVYYFLRNKLLYMRKNTSWWHWPVYILVFFVYYCGGFLLLSFLHRRRPRLRVMMQALFDFFAHRWGRQEIQK